MAVPAADPHAVLAKALGTTGGALPDAPAILPPAEAMQKLQPLMTSLKQACGLDRTWAPAVHRLLHVMMSTISLHTHPGAKLFCPCCTQHKNRDLFGHYYNTSTLVCKRCSTKFRELVNSNKLSPQTDAFHARLVSVMSVAAVGTRKRKSAAVRARAKKAQAHRKGLEAGTTVSKRARSAGAGSGAGAGSASKAAARAYPPPAAAALATGAASAAPTPVAMGLAFLADGKDCETEDDGESAVSSGSNTDHSVVLGGLWADVPSSGSSESGDSSSGTDTVDPGLFYDIFEQDMQCIATDLPLFGAAPGGASDVDSSSGGDDVEDVVEEAGAVRRAPVSPSGTAGSGEFSCKLGSVPTLESKGMSQEQLASLVSVKAVTLVPAEGSEVELARSSVNTHVPSGSYKLRVTLAADTPTDCMVSGMLLELPNAFRTPESWTEAGPIPRRIQWTKSGVRPATFRDTLQPVTAEGTTSLTCAEDFHLDKHRKFAVVVLTTCPTAAEFGSYREMRDHGVATLSSGGFFDVTELA